MSFTFKALIGDVKTFASKVEQEFVKLFQKAPAVLTIISAVVTYAAPVVEGLLSAINPALGSVTSAVLTEIETGLATLKAAATSVAGATTAIQAISGIQANLPALLAAVKIENPTLVSKVESVVNTLAPEFEALLAALTASSSASSAA